MSSKFKIKISSQLTFTCSKSTIETLEERCEICSKLKIRTPERWRRSGIFIVNFEHISHLSSSVSIRWESRHSGVEFKNAELFTIFIGGFKTSCTC